MIDSNLRSIYRHTKAMWPKDLTARLLDSRNNVMVSQLNQFNNWFYFKNSTTSAGFRETFYWL